MKKTLFTATLLAASLMAASTVQAAPQEVTLWHYIDQKPEQEMLADMVEEYNSYRMTFTSMQPSYPEQS